jgi:CBS domain-containing protein
MGPMKIRDIFTRNPEVTSPDDMICVAARKMKDSDVGMLPVCYGGRLVGCLTDRDLAIRAVAGGCDPLTTRVQDIMTPELFYCFEDDGLQEAAKIMEENQVRRVPVLNVSQRLVGIVSLGDLALRTHDQRLVEAILEHVCEPE